MYYTLIYNINICKVNLSSDGKNNKCKCNHIQMDFVSLWNKPQKAAAVLICHKDTMIFQV